MAAKKTKSAGTSGEWIGGIVAGPGMVTGEGPPYEPESLFWMSADGMFLGASTGRPGEVLRDAGRSLSDTMKKPLVGPKSAPARVRVASPALADALRAAHPTIEVVVAPTPEIDTMVEFMRRELGPIGGMTDADLPLTASYLTPGVTAGAMAALFRAAAALYRAAPWNAVPDDQCLFFATSDALGLKDAPISIVGQAGETFGFIAFADLDAFETFLGFADDPSRFSGHLPPHLSLNFEKKKEMPPQMVREITEHRWEVAGPKAMPLCGVMSGEGPIDPRPSDVTTLEVLATALVGVVSTADLSDLWYQVEPWTQDFVVEAHGGPVAVRLSTAESDGAWEKTTDAPSALRPDGLLAPLYDLARGREEIDPEEREELEAELYRDFLRSPEAINARIGEVDWSKCVTELAASYLGETLATLGAVGLREVVFDLIPRKVMIDASVAGEIIIELRALYGYLGREHRLAQAGDCLRVLGPDAEARLAAELSDSSQFGMGKALLAEGAAAGFDITSKEGIERWMAAASGGLAPQATRQAGAPAAAKKKNQRKAALQARKKNR